ECHERVVERTVAITCARRDQRDAEEQRGGRERAGVHDGMEWGKVGAPLWRPREVVAVEEHAMQEAVHGLVREEGFAVPREEAEDAGGVDERSHAVDEERGREAGAGHGDEAAREAPLTPQTGPHEDERPLRL